MTESALKFGPEWLRALSHGNAVTSPPSSPCMPKYKLAEYRYGREEMLALFEKNIKIPEDLAEMDGLVTEKWQMPLAYLSTTEEEQRTWARSVNSDAVLRLMGRGSDRGTSSSSTRAGRGVSSDRGRGRGRGYYPRGISSEDGIDGPSGGYSCPRPFERSQSMHERSQSWEEKEKERRYEKGYSVTESGRSFDTTWRRERETDDDGGWRTTITSRDRTNWRTCDDKEHDRDFDRDRSNDIVHNREANEKHFGQIKPRKNKSWETNHDAGGDKLPEWSTEDNGNVGFVGTFDSSGAFLENKAPCNEIHVSGNTADVSKAALKSSHEQECREEITKVREIEHPIKETEEIPPNSSQTVKKAHTSCSVPPKTPSPTSSTVFSVTSQNQPLQRTSPMATKSVSASVFETKNTSSPAEGMDANFSASAVEMHKRGIMDQQQHQHQLNTQINHLVVEKLHPPSLAHLPPNLKPVDLASATFPLKSHPESDRADEVNFEHLEKAAENFVAKWTAEEDEKAAQKEHANTALPAHHEEGSKWFYKDPQGQVQGPFTSHEMTEWFNAGYFSMNLSVRRGCDEKFSLLGDLIKCWGRIPFTPGLNPPPLLMNVPHNAPTIVNPEQAPLPAGLQNQEQMYLIQQHLLQQQIIRQHMIQQQLFMRYQAHMQQTFNVIKDQEGFCNLTPQQQHHLLLQQMQQLPAGPPGQEAAVPDFLQQLQQLMTMNPQSKDEVMSAWNALNSSLNLWNMNNGKQQGNSVWELENGMKEPEVSLAAMQELERKRKEDEERVVEENMKQQQERLLQEKAEQKRQEEVKQELLKKMKLEEELKNQKQEEVRLEELRKEQERKMLEEQRKIEEQKRKEQQMEEERRKKDEERKRKEEERKKKELKKRQEEEQKRKEAEMELQRQKQLERERELKEKEQLEKLAQQELQRQQELQKLEQQRQQMEVLQRLEEKQKAEKAASQVPAWGVCANAAPSLIEIQKMQEEKERQEREEQKRLVQTVQQLTPVLNTHQKANANLTWAKKPSINSHPVKSLLEIQKEEAEKVAIQNKVLQQQQQQQQQKQQTQNLPLMTTGVWGNASSNLSWASPPNSSWGLDAVNNSTASGGCFWDDAMNASNVRKSSAQTEKISDQKISSQNKSLQALNPSNNKNKNSRTKKDEDTVMKIFGSHTQTVDDFTQWCFQALSALQSSSVDIPTFVAFLKDVEASGDVQEYVRSYLGETKDTQEFAKQFLERRNRYKIQTKPRNEEKKPLPPVYTAKVPPPQSRQQYVDPESQKGGAKKKKKNKMQKVDSSILGFTVHASIDRINVGEIERLESM